VLAKAQYHLKKRTRTGKANFHLLPVIGVAMLVRAMSYYVKLITKHYIAQIAELLDGLGINV